MKVLWSTDLNGNLTQSVLLTTGGMIHNSDKVKDLSHLAEKEKGTGCSEAFARFEKFLRWCTSSVAN